MPIYAVIAIRNASAVKKKVAEHAPNGKHYDLTSDSWLVEFDGTTQEAAETFGIRDNEEVSGVVLRVAEYSGRSKPNLWEWFKVRWSPSS